ncbi:MAG: hypothetical protein BGO41_10845 [Clostridiales bacterium 38-18]|nr:MAG: hypothetical protein BGO41_10845 [Clostridiales bacterium 38-18]
MIDKQYEAVIALAKEAGTLQMHFFRSDSLSIETKSTSVDMVTEADIACDKLIVSRLKELFPGDQILSEEQGYQPNAAASDYEWIIDPLDGTTNFSIGHPIFAVSIARWYKNKPEFGVVYVPTLEEIYFAQRGEGAYRVVKDQSPVRLCASTQSELGKSVLATGFPYDRATAKNNNSQNIATMVPLVKGLRRLGAAAYDLCLVAAGVYDAFWELRLGKWDLAAGALMITEAGGEFNYHYDAERYNVISGSSEICKAIEGKVYLSNNGHQIRDYQLSKLL